MKRQFITKTEIDRVLEEGRTVLEVDATTTVTDLAREYAMQRGLSLRHVGAGEAPSAPPEAQPGEDLSGMRGAVRSAVIAQLGEVPPGLDGALDKVLGPRPSG